MSPFPIDRVRREFPALSRPHDGIPRVFMDNPAGTQLPRRVVDAVSNALVDAASNYGGFFENSRNAQTIEGRVESYSDLAGALADVFVTRPSAYWMERLHEQEVPFAPVCGTDEVLADPQVRHLGSIYEVAQAGAEPFKAIRRPVHYDGERGRDAAPAPLLGQHNQRVLAEAGFGTTEIAELMGAGRRPPRPRDG